MNCYLCDIIVTLINCRVTKQMSSSLGAYVSQIAFSVSNLEHAVRFYRDTFLLRDSGGTTAFRGPGAAYVQGIEGIASRTHWLQDDRSMLQLEFFQFEYPPLTPIPAARRACDRRRPVHP